MEARKFRGLSTQGDTGHLQDSGLCPVSVGFLKSKYHPVAGSLSPHPVSAPPHTSQLCRALLLSLNTSLLREHGELLLLGAVALCGHIAVCASVRCRWTSG